MASDFFIIDLSIIFPTMISPFKNKKPFYPFQVLVDIEHTPNLKKGLIIPDAMKNLVSKHGTIVKLIDANEEYYVVCLDRAEGMRYQLCRLDWPDFVSKVVDLSVRKVCIRLVNANNFKVICFDENGIEYKQEINGKFVQNRCLVYAIEHCLIEQMMNNTFLSIFNVEVRGDRTYEGPPKVIPQKKVHIAGSEQRGDVDVIFQLVESQKEWIACGFNGSKWTNICMVNNIQTNDTLMFSREMFNLKRQGIQLGFNLDVFNEFDISHGDAGVEDEFDDEYIEWNEEEMDIPDEDMDRLHEFLHCCRVKAHGHKSLATHFYKLINYSHFEKNLLSLEWNFVAENHLNGFPKAKLKFGVITFFGDMITKYDSRIAGEQNHVVVKADWRKFFTEAGLVEGDRLRFQLNVKKCVSGELAVFDLC